MGLVGEFIVEKLDRLIKYRNFTPESDVPEGYIEEFEINFKKYRSLLMNFRSL